jgi:ribosomal protein L12E/L44/L45/RPP1/RPP2
LGIVTRMEEENAVLIQLNTALSVEKAKLNQEINEKDIRYARTMAQVAVEVQLLKITIKESKEKEIDRILSEKNHRKKTGNQVPPRKITKDDSPPNVRNVKRWKDKAIEVLTKDVLTTPQLTATVDHMYRKLVCEKVQISSAITLLRGKHPEALLAVLPQEVIARIVRQGQQDFANAVQKNLSVANCLRMKYNGFLSRDKYETMSNTISCAWTDGQWLRQSFNGVPFPKLQSRYQLEKVVNEMKVASGLEAFDGGLVVKVDLRALIITNLMESIRTGKFYIDQNGNVKQEHGRDPELMLVLDSALHHKGMKVSSAGFVFPHGAYHPMAPSNTHEYAHIEGGDGNDDMATMGKRILEGEPTNHYLVTY